MSHIKNYAFNLKPKNEDKMNRNRRESDSAFAALFPDSMVVAKKHIENNTIKFPHTKERKRFIHLLTAHAYIREQEIVNPHLTHHKNAITGDEWVLEWIAEEQS